MHTFPSSKTDIRYTARPLHSLLWYAHCCSQAIDGTCDPQYEVPINQGPITINSALIEGVMEVHVRGLPNSHKNIFEGKKRHLQIMVQVGMGAQEYHGKHFLLAGSCSGNWQQQQHRQ